MRYIQPIVIKKYVKTEEPHHNMAWKVAYADFVTAMMAFFLLLWLLAVLNTEQKESIADYFNPTVGFINEAGMGIKGGEDSTIDTGTGSPAQEQGIAVNQVAQGNAPPVSDPPKPAEGEKEAAPETMNDNKDDVVKKEFMALSESISQLLITEQKVLKQNVQVERADDMLKINLINDPKAPLFFFQNAKLTDKGKKAINSVAGIIAGAKRQISITGYSATDNAMLDPKYSHWDLSMDRANAMRRMLIDAKVSPGCIMRVEGMADHELLVPTEPANPRNNRVTIIVLNKDCFS